MSDNNNNNYNFVSESCSLCGRTFLKPEPCICQIVKDLRFRIEELEKLSHPRSTNEIKLGCNSNSIGSLLNDKTLKRKIIK
jgi:hypothetical protein